MSEMNFTPTGYQGPAAHTNTPGCAGDHPLSEPCPQRPRPVVIVFDPREASLPWLEPLATAVREQSGGRVVITEVDAGMSDAMIAVAGREVGVDEAVAIWHGEAEADRAYREPGQ